MLKLRGGSYIGNDLEKAIIDFLERNREEARLILDYVYFERKKKKNRRKIKKHGKTI